MKLEDALKWMETNESKCDHEGNICPISKQPIKNKITLNCGHSFEYHNLFHELIKNGKNTKFHKCPYCRQISIGFIPYYEMESMEKYYKVKNRLNNFNNNYLTCEHVFKSGKNKGTTCNKCAHKFSHGNYCFLHKRIKQQKENTKTPEKSRCSHILKNGNQCKKSCSKNSNEFCYIHAENK